MKNGIVREYYCMGVNEQLQNKIWEVFKLSQVHTSLTRHFFPQNLTVLTEYDQQPIEHNNW